jgi:hypothetical protein
MNEKLLFLFKLINYGQQIVYEDTKGNYYSERQESIETTTRSVQSRLMLELYGEYPLSPSNKNHYDAHIKPLFFK